ncbi:MAG TPA: TSUP family transporter [Acidimicrobiia bacterium]|nr:TSUP family transporter [Acidimicrobiia bacterium]
METLNVATGLLALVAIFISFVISASAGLGGSLLLVPALVLVLGPKEGVALAALLLGVNNLVKVIAYQATLPLRRALPIVVMISVGAWLGASLLVRTSDQIVGIAVVAAFGLTLVLERLRWQPGRLVAGPVMAFGSGAVSGFSGTSGPLKGAAIRNLDLDRFHFVGAASLASLAGDLTKVTVFSEAAILGTSSYAVALVAVPLMLAGTLLGRGFNQRTGERGFAILLWSVMAGYTFRLISAVV